MRYVALVERTTADYNGVCVEKYTEAFLIGEMETMQSVFQRVNRKYRVERILVVPLHEINEEVFCGK